MLLVNDIVVCLLHQFVLNIFSKDLHKKLLSLLPLEIMEHYKIDMMCVNDIKQTHYSWGLEPAAGTIIGEGVNRDHGASTYHFQPSNLRVETVNVEISYKIGSIITRKNFVVCQRPVKNILPFGNSKQSKMHWASCVHLPSKVRFSFGCTHVNESQNELRQTILGADKMISKLPP